MHEHARRWGILGTGNAARNMAAAIRSAKGSTLQAVATSIDVDERLGGRFNDLRLEAEYLEVHSDSEARRRRRLLKP